MSKKTSKVIVLGGGLAGLSAAYELAKAGFSVTVYEKDSQVGGLAKTIRVKGFSFDTGPHRWYTKNSRVNKWFLDILKGEIIRVPRLTRIYFDGKFFYYPIKLTNALLGIGPLKALLAVLDYFIARIKVRLLKPQLLTMEEGYISQFGTTLYETFFKRYSEKLWGTKCNNISIDWVGQRTRGLNIITLIKEMLFKSNNVVSLVDEFSYPKDGIGQLSDKLVGDIRKYGGKVYTNSQAVKIYRKKNKILAVDVKQNGKIQKRTADYYISSIPLDELAKNIQPVMDGKVIKSAGNLKYRDESQVVLFVKKTHITPDTWIYVHPKEIPFMRFMEMDNWSGSLSAKGTTSVIFEVACNEGDNVWNMKDKDMIELVSKSYINEFKFIGKKDILGGFVHRVSKEYPVYHLDYKKDVNIIKKSISSFLNLQTIGRNGTFRYNNMDHSVEMGLYAAWNLIRGKQVFDVDGVNVEREYLEEKKLENIEDETLEDSPK